MNELWVKYARSGLDIVMSQMSQPEGSKNVEFIDPLCTIIKLCLVSLKQEGIKLSIQNNVITFQDPWVLQGLQRWYREDDRSQLAQLKLPLLYFRGLMLRHHQHEHLNISSQLMETLHEGAIKGLKKLKLTYVDDKTCIDDMIRILETKYTSEGFVSEMVKMNATVYFAMYHEFVKQWNTDDVDIIVHLFNLSQVESSVKIRHQWTNCIDQYLKVKDMKLDVIRPSST